MIEKTDNGMDNFNQALTSYMERRRWTDEEQVDMFRYIGRSLVSAEGVLEVLYRAEAVHDRQDKECLTAGVDSYDEEL